MPGWAKRVLFYGGNFLIMWLMTTELLRDVIISVLGDSAGAKVASFVRTNVEAPFIAVWIAAYLDWVLSRRTRRSEVAADRAPSTV